MVNSAGKFWLPDFDKNAIFVVAAWPKGQTVNGVELKPGQIFNKTSVQLRTLQRLYMDRHISMVDQCEPEPTIVPTPVTRRRRASAT